MAHNVLLVEDDPDVAELARAYLQREGFEVEVCHDGLAGHRAALERPPALVILDVMLPHLDGLGLLQRLRRESQTPVILLTARSEENDRIVGLEAGADDYVTKPFSPRELVARVKAALRRTGLGPEGGLISHGDLEVNPAYRSVTVRDTSVPLTTLEFDLLHALAQSPGRVFTREELLDRVWGSDFSGVDRVVDVHVSNLRQKLAHAGTDNQLVTVRGVGYKLK